MKRPYITVLSIFLILLVAAVVIGLFGRSDEVKRQHRDRLMAVEKYDDCTIYVDTETGTEYIEKDGGLAPVLDYNGFPVQWEAFDAREDRYPSREASKP